MRILLLTLLSLGFLGCDQKPAGFGLENSPIRYRTAKFEDPQTLAGVLGQKYTKGQILDKSPVLKDLEEQEAEAVIALCYMKITDRFEGQKMAGNIEIYLPQPKHSLQVILNRFDRTPQAGLNVSYHGADSSGLLATFRDIKVTRDDLNMNNVVLQSIEMRRFQEISSQLNSQLTRILLSQTAADQKRDLQTYLKDEVFGGSEVTITDQELADYLQSIGFAKEEMTPELKPRFVEALRQQKQQALMESYVAKKILKGPIEVSFTAPEGKLKLNESWTPVMGYADAPVALVAFSGTNCPDCPKFIESLYSVMQKHKGHLKLNWIYNFNESDGIAQMLAEAALCVDSVKKGRSMGFLNEFAKAGAQVEEKAFYTWAEKNSVNVEAFKKCFVEKSDSKLLSQHIEYAKKVGIVANPTLWVEGRTLQGVIPLDQLDRVVSEAIRSKGSGNLSALWRRLKGMLGQD